MSGKRRQPTDFDQQPNKKKCVADDWQSIDGKHRLPFDLHQQLKKKCVVDDRYSIDETSDIATSNTVETITELYLIIAQLETRLAYCEHEMQKYKQDYNYISHLYV